jgi:hypothetical protein
MAERSQARQSGGEVHLLEQRHAQRGEKDEAFAALDRAWTFRDPGLALLRSDRFLDPLRGDPRFAAEPPLPPAGNRVRSGRP